MSASTMLKCWALMATITLSGLPGLNAASALPVNAIDEASSSSSAELSRNIIGLTKYSNDFDVDNSAGKHKNTVLFMYTHQLVGNCRELSDDDNKLIELNR